MSSPSLHLVTTPEDLVQVCAQLEREEWVGLDTEFVGEDSFRPHLCLVQVATRDALFLLDPLAIPDLQPFWTVLVQSGRNVAVHAGREEARLIQHYVGQRPNNLFDTQIAAGLVGYGYPMGHAPLVYEVLGIRLSKSETLTDWRKRPLTSQQIQYAYDDVRHLLQLVDHLRDRLEALKRQSWLAEEFERWLDVATDETVQERWRKLPGLGSLRPKQLAVVRELYQWRQEVAAQRNRPPRTVCRDDLLVEVARRSPTKERDIQIIRGIPHKLAGAMLATVEQARHLPPDQWPPQTPRDVDPPQVQLLGQILSAVLAQLCMDQQLAQSLVCTTADLRSLVRSHVLPKLTPSPTILDAGWRRAFVKEPLEAVLRGEKSLRVSQPKSSSPLEIISIDSGGSSERQPA